MNQANLLRIREDVETDVMGLDWPKMTDDELAASMNAATLSRRRLAPRFAIGARCATTCPMMIPRA